MLYYLLLFSKLMIDRLHVLAGEEGKAATLAQTVELFQVMAELIQYLDSHTRLTQEIGRVMFGIGEDDDHDPPPVFAKAA